MPKLLTIGQRAKILSQKNRWGGGQFEASRNDKVHESLTSMKSCAGTTKKKGEVTHFSRFLKEVISRIFFPMKTF